MVLNQDLCGPSRSTLARIWRGAEGIRWERSAWPWGPHSPTFSYSASLGRQAVHTPGFMAPSSQQNHPDLYSGHHVPSFWLCPSFLPLIRTLWQHCPRPHTIFQDNLPISRPLTITSAKPLWPRQVTNSQVLRIRAWTALGLFCLPHVWSQGS